MVTGYLQSTENLSEGIWWFEYNLFLMVVVGLFVLGGFFRGSHQIKTRDQNRNLHRAMQAL